MNPVDQLLDSIIGATVQNCEAFAPDIVLDATVPGWRLRLHGADRVRGQFAGWFADPGQFEQLRRTPLPYGELVEFLLTWQEPAGPFAASQAHVIEVSDGRITTIRMWCGGRWSEADQAEMAAANESVSS